MPRRLSGQAGRGTRCICADDDGGGIGEKLADALPDEAVVVDDEDSNHRPLPSLTARDLKRRFASGIVATTVVPRRGALRIVKSPPSSSARSRIPSNPKESGAATFPG